jgi:radical SAM protein with 4Fe4S-binding SPASM domain
MSTSIELVQWDITSRCNLSCKHCRLGFSPNVLQELGTDEGLNLLSQVIESKAPLLNFSGGEPFLRNDLFVLLNHVFPLFKEITITTNATLLDQDIVEKLRRYKNLRLSISLDNVGDAHDDFRGVRGVFEKVVGALHLLRENQVRFSIRYTVSVLTKSPFDVVMLAKKFNAENLDIRSVIPVGRASYSLLLTTDDYVSLVRRVLSLGKKIDLRITSGDPFLIPFFPEIVGETENSLAQVYSGCLAGDGLVYIDSRGTVFPCAYIPISGGSIRERPLAEILNDQTNIFAILKSYKDKLKGKCGICKFKYACGGCRAFSLATNGDVLSEDPRCGVDV